MESEAEIVETCHRHPKVETTLHCYQCGVPICTKCAHRTPVGYICQDCLRGRKQRYDQSRPMDYVLAGILSLVLGGIASLLPIVGWFVIFLSPVAGGLIAQLVWRVVGRRHGQYIWIVVVGGIILATLPALLIELLVTIGVVIDGDLWGLLNLLWVGVHLFLACGAVIARLRML